MSAEFTVLNIFFRVLNSAIVFGLCAYLFKRYALDGLKNGMREQEEQKKVLYESAVVLERERELAIAKAREQELVIQRLQEHVRHWRMRFEIVVANRQSEKQRLIQELARKSALQQERLAADVIAHQVFAQARMQAQKTLTEEFAQKSAGQAYVGDIMAFIKKSAR